MKTNKNITSNLNGAGRGGRKTIIYWSPPKAEFCRTPEELKYLIKNKLLPKNFKPNKIQKEILKKFKEKEQKNA